MNSVTLKNQTSVSLLKFFHFFLSFIGHFFLMQLRFSFFFLLYLINNNNGNNNNNNNNNDDNNYDNNNKR